MIRSRDNRGSRNRKSGRDRLYRNSFVHDTLTIYGFRIGGKRRREHHAQNRAWLRDYDLYSGSGIRLSLLHANLRQPDPTIRGEQAENPGAGLRQLKTDFARIQSVHRVLQYNPYLTDYLDGVYESDADSVYALTRYILPLNTQSMFANPEIESIVIYKMKDRVLPITNLFRDRSMLDPRTEQTVSSLKAGQGKWLRADPAASDPDLIYYQYIYNTQITERIGLLEIRVRKSLIHNFYAAAGVEGNWRALLLSGQGDPLTNEAAGLDKKTLRLLQAEDRRFFINRQTIVNQLKLEPLDVRVIVTGQVGDVFRSVKKKEIVLVTMIVLLLIALSIAYYLLASTITKRILRLARHMRTLNDNNLRQLTIKSGKFEKDEIGFLIVTYNAMVRRMDELINNVHRAEMRNKEAAYQVLQAQIKPHFLYNTLETIRMVAEANDDKEVADISFWFGKLMRYSLSSAREETVLAKEIEMVSFYMNIHKMRLQSRLTFEIQRCAGCRTAGLSALPFAAAYRKRDRAWSFRRPSTRPYLAAGDGNGKRDYDRRYRQRQRDYAGEASRASRTAVQARRA